MVPSSLPPLRRLLAWAAELGMSIRGQLSEEQLIALERVFSGQAPWSIEHYSPLRVFAHALPLLNEAELPALLSFGDVLSALDELRSAAVAAWPTHETVSESTFGELGYTATSAAITRLRDANAGAWREHAGSNRELLLRGAERASGTRGVVIGAGKLYDIPLRKLAERFEQLLLVDIDAAAMTESVKQVGLEPKLQSRLTLVQADVTGINDVFVERARAALALPGEHEVYAALLELLEGYRVDLPPRLFPQHVIEGTLDFACSSMVLSQLATPLTRYIQDQFAARFPGSARSQAPELQVALGQFTHGVQQAHVRSLFETAPCIALTSDVSDQYTSLDARGTLMASARLPLIGGPSLGSLVPRQQASVTSSGEWEWRDVVPTRSKPRGHTLQVAGVVAERAAT